MIIEMIVKLCPMSATSSNSVADLRSSGFLMRHWETNDINSDDQSAGFLKVGGGFVGIIKIALNVYIF